MSAFSGLLNLVLTLQLALSCNYTLKVWATCTGPISIFGMCKYRGCSHLPGRPIWRAVQVGPCHIPIHIQELVQPVCGREWGYFPMLVLVIWIPAFQGQDDLQIGPYDKMQRFTFIPSVAWQLGIRKDQPQPHCLYRAYRIVVPHSAYLIVV